MNYDETLEFMYALLPMYQRIGNAAFKKDLTNTYRLCAYLGNPQNQFKSVHIAGTNGKGSSAHMLASIMQEAGYKTGLYTSPHLKSFTERIKINGEEVAESFVVDFIERVKDQIKEIQPSFFELTVAMAFDYFAEQEVDIAVIEVGLGGRFDSTNVLVPIVSLITSIGLDHTDMLGETLPEIAFEKAGIIKKNVPVVISQTQDEIVHVFENRATEEEADIIFADSSNPIANSKTEQGKLFFKSNYQNSPLEGCSDLGGSYQLQNIPGVLKTAEVLGERGFEITTDHISRGLRRVGMNTGLKGRWQVLKVQPLVLCDTVHNELGLQYLEQQLKDISYKNLFIVWGTVQGKDLEPIFSYLPKEAFYYFCEASIPRALPATELAKLAKRHGRQNVVIKDVNEAVSQALGKAEKDDLIFIGGSNFIIAELEDLE